MEPVSRQGSYDLTDDKKQMLSEYSVNLIHQLQHLHKLARKTATPGWALEGLNNRNEGSHRLTRKQKKIQGRFKSARQAQKFLVAHDEAANLFRPCRHKITASTYRQKRASAFRQWNECAIKMAAWNGMVRLLLRQRK